MKKNMKVGISVAIITLIVLSVILGIIFIDFPKASVTTPSGDMTIDSITKTTINGEDAIRVAVTVNRGGEQLAINFDTTTLNNALQQTTETKGLKATKPITGRMTFNEESRFFPYVQGSGSLGTLYKKFRIVDCGFHLSCNASQCSIGAGEEILGVKRFFNCGALVSSEKTDYGTWGNVANGDFKVTFAIDSIGSVQLTRNVLSADLGSGNMIKWDGNKISWDSFYMRGEEPYLFNSRLYIQPSGTYSAISSIKNNLVQQFNDMPSGRYQSEAEALVTPANSNILQYWKEDYLASWKSSASNSPVLSDAILSNSGLTVYFRQPMSYPTFVIDLKANDVGIIKLSGTPSISNCPTASTCSFQSNEIGKTQVTVKNVGTGEGYFNFGSENCNVINTYSAGSNQLGSFQAGEQKSIDINVQGSTAGTTQTGSCSIYIYDTNNPSFKSSCSMNCEVKKNLGGQCEEGSKRCSFDSKNIEVCNSANWVALSSCSDGVCGYDTNSQPICKGSNCKPEEVICADDSECCNNLVCDKTTNKCIKPSEDSCSPKWYYLGLNAVVCKLDLWLAKFKLVFSIVIGLLTGIVGLFISKNLLDNFKNSEKQKWGFAVAIALVLGIGIGLLAFWYFYFSLITLVLIIIVKIIL